MYNARRRAHCLPRLVGGAGLSGLSARCDAEVSSPIGTDALLHHRHIGRRGSGSGAGAAGRGGGTRRGRSPGARGDCSSSVAPRTHLYRGEKKRLERNLEEETKGVFITVSESDMDGRSFSDGCSSCSNQVGVCWFVRKERLHAAKQWALAGARARALGEYKEGGLCQWSREGAPARGLTVVEKFRPRAGAPLALSSDGSHRN